MKKRPRGYLQEPKNLIYDYKQRAKEGKKLNPYALEQEDQSLYTAIMREFDSFDDFLIECGFEPEDIRIQQKWTLDKLKKELDRIYKQGIKIHYHNKLKNYSKKQYKVFRMLIYYFDSIEQGLKHFNYSLSEYRRLERLCPKCKQTIIPFESNKIVCQDCKK
mgnify:CR=1 FL=1